MKFTIAPLLLSSVFASKAGKLAKFSKVKGAKAAKSKSAYGSMSASMSVGPEPPITVTGVERYLLTRRLFSPIILTVVHLSEEILKNSVL
jgi:hypothetical protein